VVRHHGTFGLMTAPSAALAKRKRDSAQRQLKVGFAVFLNAAATPHISGGELPASESLFPHKPLDFKPAGVLALAQLFL
jgi:hypothetical protein